MDWVTTALLVRASHCSWCEEEERALCVLLTLLRERSTPQYRAHGPRPRIHHTGESAPRPRGRAACCGPRSSRERSVRAGHGSDSRLGAGVPRHGRQVFEAQDSEEVCACLRTKGACARARAGQCTSSARRRGRSTAVGRAGLCVTRPCPCVLRRPCFAASHSRSPGEHDVLIDIHYNGGPLC